MKKFMNDELFEGMYGASGGFELSLDALDDVAGGGGYNAEGVVADMRRELISTKKLGMSKKQCLDMSRHTAEQASLLYGENSDAYFNAMEHYEYIKANWDKV